MNHVIHCTIEGTSPILLHAFPLVAIEPLEKKTPAEQAEIAAYRDPDTGELYFPGVNIQRGLVAAAAFSKGKRGASLQKLAAACLIVSPERVSFARKDYAVDARAVVVPATKGRVVRYRPRLDEWRFSFALEFDPDLLTANQVRRIVDDLSVRVGIGDFRPEKKGPFGRFQVVEWKSNGKA